MRFTWVFILIYVYCRVIGMCASKCVYIGGVCQIVLTAKYIDCICASVDYPAVWSICHTPRRRTSPPGFCVCARGSSDCMVWWSVVDSTCRQIRTLVASCDGSRPYGRRCQYALPQTWWRVMLRVKSKWILYRCSGAPVSRPVPIPVGRAHNVGWCDNLSAAVVCSTPIATCRDGSIPGQPLADD